MATRSNSRQSVFVRRTWLGKRDTRSQLARAIAYACDTDAESWLGKNASRRIKRVATTFRKSNSGGLDTI